LSETCAVLLVEDDPGLRAVMAEVLALEGFEVRSAANGRDALAVLGQWRSDLIVTDLNMPIMDGRGFREELARRPRLAGIPVIVLSAALTDDDMADRLGAAAVLRKPCDFDVLIDAIRRAARRPGGVRSDARIDRRGGCA
jgi:CheY-like chemotaxis protein